MRIDGKTIVVTGGESGIGRSIAIECARQGGRIFVAGLQEDGLRETVAWIGRAGAAA